MTKLSRIIAILVLLALLPAVSACNTVHGMGEDIKAAGGAISKAGSENK